MKQDLPQRMRHALPCFLLAIMLAGCAGETMPFPYQRLSPVAPPPAPYEEKPASEQPMAETWRAGYWSYNGIDFSWNTGTMISRPDPTAVWSADRWEERSYGWAYVPGYWQ